MIVPARWELWMSKLNAVIKRMTAPAERDSSKRNLLPRSFEALGYFSSSSGSIKKKATALKTMFSRPNPIPMRRLAATVSGVAFSGAPLSSLAVLKNVELKKAKMLTPIIVKRRHHGKRKRRLEVSVLRHGI
jgi:hypothetical protein